MPISDLASFQSAFASLTDDQRKQKFNEEESILRLSTTPASNRLHEILPYLHPDNYAKVLDHMKNFRKQKKLSPLDFNYIVEIFPTLKTAAQTQKLCDYCKATISSKYVSMTQLTTQLVSAASEIRVTALTHFRKYVKTGEDFRNVLDCLTETERTNMKTPENPLNIFITKNKAFQKILDSKIANPQTSNTEIAIRLALKVYDAIRSMTSFTFFRSNKWKNDRNDNTFMSNEQATGLLDKLTTHQKQKPRSSTMQAMVLAAQTDKKNIYTNIGPVDSQDQEELQKETFVSETDNKGLLSENGLVLETIKAGFRKAPFYASVNVDGHTFFRSASLNKHLQQRNATAPLTGATVETVRNMLGFAR